MMNMKISNLPVASCAAKESFTVTECVIAAFDEEVAGMVFEFNLVNMDSIRTRDGADTVKTYRNSLVDMYHVLSGLSLHDYFTLDRMKELNGLLTSNEISLNDRILVGVLNNTVAGALCRLHRVYGANPAQVLAALVDSVCHVPSQQYNNDSVHFYQVGDAANLRIGEKDVTNLITAAPIVGVVFHIRLELTKTLLAKTLSALIQPK